MSISQLILQNLKSNLKHYYLYVFALIFSVALYFAFVTLQYDPAMNDVESSMKGAAAIRTASVLLVAIVTVFNLYANNIFVKRRSKEIGLLQLIGMTKQKIFRILSTENAILYFGSLTVGVLLGFSVSKLIVMILFRITGIEVAAVLRFSTQALVQTVLVFAAIYFFILTVNYVFIRRQSILSLFRVTSSTEAKVKRLSVMEVILGMMGLALVLTGYAVSSKLFGGDFTTMNQLALAMIFILASVIIGTYLFYKGSVRLILNILRKRKNGYLNVREVLSLSTVMFRMKSNALLLTVITTLSALSIGLLSLSYISYYSAEKSAQQNVPAHFAVTDIAGAEQFGSRLDEQGIDYRETRIEVVQVVANLANILDVNLSELNSDPGMMTLPVVSDTAIEGVDVEPGETVFTGYNDLMQSFMTLKDAGTVTFSNLEGPLSLSYEGLRRDYPISYYFTSGGLPVGVVDATDFTKLQQHPDPALQNESSLYIGIDIEAEDQLGSALEIYYELGYDEKPSYAAQLDMSQRQKQNMGLILFIVGFLGLAFLMTSGCILYFKQLEESEEEQPSYTILRKLGYTAQDLVGGIRLKQLFSFGIPLLIGLSHSYFAVQSGWFLFGTELWTPMLAVMVLYTGLYSIFGVLSVAHYRKVIRRAL